MEFREKTTATLLIAIFLISTFVVAMPIQANNSIDTLGTPSHWAVITLEDEFHVPYGELWLIGWETYASSESGLDGTINHVIWEVAYVDGARAIRFKLVTTYSASLDCMRTEHTNGYITQRTSTFTWKPTFMPLDMIGVLMGNMEDFISRFQERPMDQECTERLSGTSRM